MEKEVMLTRKRTEIDVYCPAKAIPTGQTLWRLALEVP
jgi:hypothetical protein